MLSYLENSYLINDEKIIQCIKQTKQNHQIPEIGEYKEIHGICIKSGSDFTQKQSNYWCFNSE